MFFLPHQRGSVAPLTHTGTSFGWRQRHTGGAVGAILLAFVLGVGAPEASGTTCPNYDDLTLDYNCSEGPNYVLPNWVDINGWNDPSSYLTIQTCDVDGDKILDLIGRGMDGLHVQQFDPVNGQWIPADAEMALSALSDADEVDNWTAPQYYTTIQCAAAASGPTLLVARGVDGIQTYQWVPGTDTGSWKELASAGPLKDANEWDQAEYYTTIQTAVLDQNGASLLVRGPNGMQTYAWSGSQWEQVGGFGPLGDTDKWNTVDRYSTIQTTDSDGDGLDDLLLGRGEYGMVTWQWDGSAQEWTQLRSSGPFTDADTDTDWTAAEYYATIQTADIDGDGDAELLGRGVDGIQVYQWDTSSQNWAPLATTGPFMDADTDTDTDWTAAEYYTTIQLADIDGDGDAELLGRGSKGLQTYQWDSTSTTWQALVTDEPALLNVPWQNTEYYATLQTGDVDGDGAAEVLGRGPYGVRTWFYNTKTNPTTKYGRYLPYGFPDFATTGQNTAFDVLNKFLGIETEKTVRDAYINATSNQLQGYQDCLADPSGSPGQAISLPTEECSGDSLDTEGISEADWTPVATEILSELIWRQLSIDYFEKIYDANSSLFADESGQFPSQADSMNIDQVGDNTAELGYLGLFSDVFSFLGVFTGEGAFWAMSTAFATIANATEILSSSSTSTFTQTYDDIEEQMEKIQQQLKDLNGEQSTYVGADAGLIATVGTLVNSLTWSVDPNAIVSAGRQQFTIWVYQAFLPSIWELWEVTGCKDDHSTLNQLCCSPPASGPYMQPDDDNEENFTGILPIQTPCLYTEPCLETDPNCDSSITNCTWTTPESDIAAILWGEISTDCTYDPTKQEDTPWEYGCNLDLGSDMFTNTSDWNFTTKSCDAQQCPIRTSDGTTLQGMEEGTAQPR